MSGLDPPKRGPPQPDFKLASGSTFSVALPHTEAVPVLALSVPCSLLVAVALCVAVVAAQRKVFLFTLSKAVPMLSLLR